jgi:hypothetical protein
MAFFFLFWLVIFSLFLFCLSLNFRVCGHYLAWALIPANSVFARWIGALGIRVNGNGGTDEGMWASPLPWYDLYYSSI